MAPRVDILDERERLGKPLVGSVALHAGIAAVLIASPFITRGNRVPWGSQDAGGGMGAISVNVVGRVPLPAMSGRLNPVANDTEAQVPAPPPKTKPQLRAREPEPDAIPLRSKNAPRRAAAESASANKWRAQQQDRPNQMYSAGGQGLVSQLIGQEGSGGVGIGDGTPFGNRFGEYALRIKQIVARNWNTSDVDSRIRTAPAAIVTFTILRDGQVKNVRVTQRSGNPLLDASCQRAVYDASPLPPLPAESKDSEVTVDFWFMLSR